MATGRLSCFARNGRSPGEESRTGAVAARAIEAQPSSGQISQREAGGRAPNSILGRSRGQPEGACARSPAYRAKRRRPWRRIRAASSQPNRSNDSASRPHLSARPRDASSKGSWRAALSYRVEASVHTMILTACLRMETKSVSGRESATASSAVRMRARLNLGSPLQLLCRTGAERPWGTARRMGRHSTWKEKDRPPLFKRSTFRIVRRRRS